jgi:hypothetical protein
LSDQSIANGTNASSCYVVEAGQPDPGIFRPDFFVLTPIPVYNVPIIRYIDYLINNTGYSARIIQYGWSGAKICPPGQTRDPATGDCSKCPVKDIPDYGPPDPPALDMTNISDRTRGAANCLKSAMGIPGDGELFESGFRTLEYQQHFVDLWNKKVELDEINNPLCAELQAKINADFNKHGLGASRLPPTEGANCHSAGTCFDVKRVQIPGVDQNAAACGVKRPYPVADPMHTVPY